MQRFDLAVVGAGLGGLAVAALVSSRRKAVVLVSTEKAAGGTAQPFTREGFRFYPCPSLAFGFESGGFFNRICSELGIPMPTGVLAREYHVALPDRRITVSDNVERTLTELKREFPREIDRVAACYRAAARIVSQVRSSRWHAYYFGWKRAQAFLDTYRFSAELRSFFDVQSRFFFNQSLEGVPLPQFATMLSVAPVTLRSGFAPYIDHLVNAIKTTGGAIRMDQTAPEFKSIRRTGAEFETGNGRIASSLVVFNDPAAVTRQTLFYAIQSDVAPVGMANDLVYLPEYERPDEYITLSLGAMGDETAAPKGFRTLTATAHGMSAEGGRELRAAVRRILPFVDEQSRFVVEGERVDFISSLPSGGEQSPILTARNRVVVGKLFHGGAYLLPDDPWIPVHTASGARRIAERAS